MPVLQSSELAHSTEFVPGYSSFLFNQLLQTQFYTVNHGGISISLNITDVTRQYSNPNTPPPIDYLLPRSIEQHSTPITQLNTLKLSSSGTITQDGTPTPTTNANTTYNSTLFQNLSTKQRDSNNFNHLFELEPRSYLPMYPEIDLMEFFGERALTSKTQARLQTLLYAPNCNLDVVKLYSRKYVPSEIRPMVWQLVFNYLPTEKAEREAVILTKQKKYTELVAHADALQCEELISQVDMDVLRTLPTGYEFLFGNSAVKATLARVLRIWAINHPAIGYFQGLNDLASPFIYVFLSHHSTYQVGKPAFFYDNDGEEDEEWADKRLSNPDPETGIMRGLLERVEADAYWCLCAVLDSVEHLNANSKCGVHGEAMMVQMEALVKVIDPTLDAHMKSERLEYVMFSFPWMLCLFVREVSLDLLVVLWDFYASNDQGIRHGFSVMHVYICAAFLLRFRNDLLKLEFPEMLKFLHRPPTKDWTTKDMYNLIAHATTLYNSYPILS